MELSNLVYTPITIHSTADALEFASRVLRAAANDMANLPNQNHSIPDYLAGAAVATDLLAKIWNHDQPTHT